MRQIYELSIKTTELVINVFTAEEKEAEAREIILNKHIIRSVGEKVGGNWKKLATELQFPEDDIAYFESEGGSPADMAVKVITIWMVSIIFMSDTF